MAGESTFEPGTVDEKSHGWAPDAPGTGDARDRAVEANRKAFEGRETQESSRGAAREDPDFAPEGVGESISRRGEDVVDDEGLEPGRRAGGTQGRTDRPVGTSTARDQSSVDPQGSRYDDE